MDKQALFDNKKELKDLIARGEKLISRLEKEERKTDLKKKTMDGLSFFQGLKNHTDKIIQKSAKASKSKVAFLYEEFMGEAGKFLDVNKKKSNSPQINIKYSKEGLISNFVNDLNVRMVKQDISTYIKNIKRVNKSLMFKLRSLDRQEKGLEIHEKLEEIKKKIEEL